MPARLLSMSMCPSWISPLFSTAEQMVGMSASRSKTRPVANSSKWKSASLAASGAARCSSRCSAMSSPTCGRVSRFAGGKDAEANTSESCILIGTATRKKSLSTVLASLASTMAVNVSSISVVFGSSGFTSSASRDIISTHWSLTCHASILVVPSSLAVTLTVTNVDFSPASIWYAADVSTSSAVKLKPLARGACENMMPTRCSPSSAASLSTCSSRSSSRIASPSSSENVCGTSYTASTFTSPSSLAVPYSTAKHGRVKRKLRR
mmetsp:Transcript_19200/g.67770  ORF Transcript_19200/g.67770 Transcript_19200/m.67770 type:complete len:265 (+) Transcript_19200:62-856(+)